MSSEGEDQKLGQILISKGLATPKQVAEAMAEQSVMEQKAGGQKFKLGQLLVFKKVLSPAQLQEALRTQVNKMTTMRSEKQSPKPRVSQRNEKPRTLLNRLSGIFFKKKS